MPKVFNIAERAVGENQPCYVIAELSCNHEGDFEEAKAIIEAAAEAGADAVKLQTYKAETLTRDFKADCGNTMWGDLDLYNLYDKAHTPWKWHKQLKDIADGLNLHFFSSPFDETAVDFLNELDVPVFKIASFEIVDTKLLQKVAQTGKPVIFSNGMSTYAEIVEAYTTLRDNGCKDISILHCNSGYPPPFDTANLQTIKAMDELFDAVIGLSDHTLFADPVNYKDPMAHVCPLEAVKLGAKIVEVHLTLDRDKSRALFEKEEGGYDWPFSRNPDELKHMIETIRAYESGKDVGYATNREKEMASQALGTVSFKPTDREKDSREFRPVLWAVEDIKAGDSLVFAAGKPGNFDSIRGPNKGEKGLHIRYADLITDKKAARNVKAGEVLTWDAVNLTG